MQAMDPTSPAPSVHAAALDGYRVPPLAHDELLGPDGAARPHWEAFLRGLGPPGLAGLAGRWREARHLLRREGVTYNVYGDPHGRDRPWLLDPIPLLISAAESAALRDGLVQRARLFEAILADLYGPQRMLTERLVPPELVFANPAFLRPCHGLAWPGGRRLHVVAFDVGRAADGTACVLSDRTQAPSGAGYCLENRLTIARLLPELFRACNVQRLAPFFRALRDGLHALAPRPEQPNAVLLTPGPLNETYFEHAVLARYLGLPLVEGSDLTVRDGRVFLKLLDGLQPVDVIWRRLDDDFCDPLELRADSFLGTPGLVQAARSGTVAIANALGSGLVESPALMPLLPRLCRRLLDEELIQPSVPTFWCGDPGGLSHALARLDELVIKPAFRPTRRPTVFGDRLSGAERDALVQRLRARPWEYVAQEVQPLSTAPAAGASGIEPRRVVVRAYLAATPGGYTLMPGGLARVAPTTEGRVVLMQHGAASKDAWVLGDGPVAPFTLLSASGQPVALSRGGSDLPSRVADDLFWLGRYAERAEGLVRLLRGVLVRLTEYSGLAEVPEQPGLLRALTRVSGTSPGFLGPGCEARLAAPEPELRALVFDAGRPGTLAFNLQAVYRTAASVRDRISSDMWRAISRLGFVAAPPAVPPTLSDLLERLDQEVLTLAGFGGLVAEGMTRGHGWRFLNMGRRLERMLHLLGLLRATLVDAAPVTPLLETPLLEALLEIADSSMTYRRRYLGGAQAGPVLDLLIADELNPRSLHAQLIDLQGMIDALPRIEAAAGPSPVQRSVLFLRSAVQLADVGALVAVDRGGRRAALDEFLGGVERALPVLADALTHCYLAHLQPTRQYAVL